MNHSDITDCTQYVMSPLIMHLWYPTVTLILHDPQGISDSDMKDSL